MADTSDFRNGLIIKFKNDLYNIVDFQHVKPGKGGAFVRSTLKNLRTGRVLENTFRSGEKVDLTNAPPFPGLTCWKSTMLYKSFLNFIISPFRKSEVSAINF